MPLPVLATPTYELTLPTTGKTVKYRPFLVKEEKVLLMALQGNDENEMLEAIKQTLNACAITPVDVESLPTVDLEYFFLKLRGKSVSDVIDLTYRCRNNITKEVQGETKTTACNNLVKFSIKIDDIQIKKDPKHTNKIMLSDTLGIVMRYPTFHLAKKFAAKPDASNNASDILEAVAACVESVFDDNNVYDQFSSKEIITFLESMTQAQFSHIQTFLDTMPTVSHTVNFTCDKCGYSDLIHLEGVASFFV
jgi:phosphotransferase system HPr-like phosphotransfer protein